MRWLDFLFWHYYSYVEQKKTVKEDGAWPAIIMTLATTSMIIGSLIADIEIFICDLPLPEKRGDLKYKVYFPLGILYILYLCYRYTKKESVIKNKYEVFRTRWGDPKHVSKKNMRILLIYTLITTIGLFLEGIIIGELNKRGVFNGCRLFP